MNDCRGIIPGILTDQRILHNRFTQKSVNISSSDTFVDRILQASSLKMNLLTDLCKHNGHTGVLTNGNHIFSGNSQIVL